jgi:hypothetical protein
MTGVERPGTRGQHTVSPALYGHRGPLDGPPDPKTSRPYGTPDPAGAA